MVTIEWINGPISAYIFGRYIIFKLYSTFIDGLRKWIMYVISELHYIFIWFTFHLHYLSLIHAQTGTHTNIDEWIFYKSDIYIFRCARLYTQYLYCNQSYGMRHTEAEYFTHLNKYGTYIQAHAGTCVSCAFVFLVYFIIFLCASWVR